MPLIERPGLVMPFCNNGDKNTIQVEASEAYTNYETGFPILQATPLGMAGAQEVKREDFNGILNTITSILYSQQMGTPNMWRMYVPGTEQSTQTRVAYPKGAHVYFNLNNDVTSAVEIVSMQDDNTVIPIDTSGETATVNIGVGKAWDYAAKDIFETKTTATGTYIKLPNNFIFQMSKPEKASTSVPQDQIVTKTFVFPVSFTHTDYIVYAFWTCETFNRQTLFYVNHQGRQVNQTQVHFNNLQNITANLWNITICVFGFI